MDAEPLVAACELAFAVAREGEKAVPPIEPPPAMRNYLYVPQLPRRAITVAERAIDEDPDFRSRVAAAATEQSVGRDGYLWLTRPAGWNSDSSQPAPIAEVPREVTPAADDRPEPAVAPAPTPPAPTAATPPTPAPTPAPTPQAPAPAAATPPTPAPPAPSRPLPSRASATPPPPPPRPRPVNAPPLPTSVVPPTAVAPATAPPAAPGNEPVPKPAAAGSIQDELADLRGLVDQLSEERENMSATAPDSSESDEAVAASAAATPSPAVPAVPTPVVEAPAAFAAQAQFPDVRPELATAQARVTELEAQLASANDRIDTATADAKSAAAQAAASAEALASRESSDAESRTKLEDDLSALQLEADAAKSDAASAATARDEAQAAVASLTGERDEAQAAVASLTGERDEAQAAVLSLTGERDESAAELQGLRHEYSVAAGALVERDHLQETLTSVRGERDELASRVEVAEQARIDLERQLSQVSEQWQALQIELESARSSLVDTRGAFRNSMQTMDDELTKTESILNGSAPTVPDLGAVEIGTAPVAATVAAEETIDTELSAGAAIAQPSIDAAPAERLAPSPFAPAVTERIEIPDVVIPDVEVPDLSVPDVELPDLSVPDVEIPNSDIQSGDLTTMLDSYGLGADAPSADLSAPIETSIDIPANLTEGFDAEGLVDVSSSTDELVAADIAFESTRTQISFPADIGHDPLAQIRLVVATDDVVVLVDGDAVAEMGWPETPVSARREALVKYLGDLAADTGAAQDTVFSGSLSDGEDLPVSRAVRVRITAPGVRPADALAELVTSYPQEWPVAVVSDDAELMVYADNNGATVLSNGQLLDLLFDRWEASQAD